MAQLTLDLAEFDKVRQEVKDKEKIILEKDKAISDKQAEIKVLENQIKGLEDRSRVLKITKSVPYQGSSTLSINHGLENILYDYFRNIERGIEKKYPGQKYFSSFDSAGYYTSRFNQIINEYVKPHNSIRIDDEPEKREFLNVSDIIEELKQKVDDDILKELSTLKVKVQTAKADEEALKATLLKEKQDLIKSYSNEIDDLNKKLTNALEMKEEKTHIQELEDHIIKLQEDLLIEKKKTWLQKLFS